MTPWEYADETFRSALDSLRRLLVDLAGVRDAIDPNEPLHDAIGAKVSELERAREELEALYEDATQELL